MKYRHYLFLFIFSLIPLIASFDTTPITLIKVPASKYNANARLKITSPKVLKRRTPILVLVSSFPIGVDVKSHVLRDLGVPINKAGSRVLLIFSNGKRVYVTKDDVNLLITQRSYFNKRFRVTVPRYIYNDIEGSNFLIYSMLVNCYGESIKNDNTFYTDVYSYDHEKQGNRSVKKQLKEPFIVYNEPYGKVDKGSILLDFFVKNAIISPDEYKIDFYVDDVKIARIYKWDPYVIKNLSKGKHNIRLELINPSGGIVKNPISVNSSTIYVK